MLDKSICYLSCARMACELKPILVVLHQEHSTPGRVGQKLRALGYRLDIRKPRFGCPLPDTLDDHDGAIVFGGPMSAYDDEPFLKRECDWLDVPLREGAPFLGLCLGAQLLAQHLGARVAPDPQGRVEVGYYPLEATVEGKRVMEWPKTVYQWHKDGFDLPAGATRLATSSGAFPEQAFQVGPAAVGLQFHPEMTAAMIYKWTVKGSERLACPGAQSRREHLEGRFLYDPAMNAWLDRFLTVWLAGRRARLSGDSLGADRAVSTDVTISTAAE